MKTFHCACGSRIYFGNQVCLACGRELGFIPATGTLTAIEPAQREWRAFSDGSLHHKCTNYLIEGVCNWMVPASDPQFLCQACRLNNSTPDISTPETKARWADVEMAKRRLVYTLNAIGLPVISRAESPDRGLAFDIQESTETRHVITGHAHGLITLNFAEADVVAREQTRIALNERYRTLLGHFRHESGHYYWDILVDGTQRLDWFRAYFGDERKPYNKSLETHYESPLAEYSEWYVSPYASAHPREDWAETWSHYLHMVDTLETAASFGFARRHPSVATGDAFDEMVADWIEVAIGLNELNQSMGLADAYPFEISLVVRKKLRFVAETIASGRHVAITRTATN